MEYEISLLTVMGMNIILALSLNMITGYCGQISLGHAAFYGTGAYCAAISTTYWGFNFATGALFAMITAAAFGFVVGLTALRVRDDFLAITTMGVGFLFLGVVRQQDGLGGEMGIAGIPGSGLGSFGFMVVVLVLAAIVIGFSIFLKRCWLGFAFDAIAQDQDTAATLGIDVSRFKLAAFVLGTMLAGLAGSIYAHHIRFVGIDSFGFTTSLAILAMVVVGGIGSVWGVVVAAAVLSVLPLWLQFIADYQLLIYGALLFFIMHFNPGGLDGIVRKLWEKRRENG